MRNATKIKVTVPSMLPPKNGLSPHFWPTYPAAGSAHECTKMADNAAVSGKKVNVMRTPKASQVEDAMLLDSRGVASLRKVSKKNRLIPSFRSRSRSKASESVKMPVTAAIYMGLSISNVIIHPTSRVPLIAWKIALQIFFPFFALGISILLASDNL